MTKRLSKEHVDALYDLYREIMPKALEAATGRLTAEHAAAGLTGIVGMAATMRAAGEPEWTRKAFRELAVMFTRLADELDGK